MYITHVVIFTLQPSVFTIVKIQKCTEWPQNDIEHLTRWRVLVSTSGGQFCCVSLYHQPFLQCHRLLWQHLQVTQLFSTGTLDFQLSPGLTVTAILGCACVCTFPLVILTQTYRRHGQCVLNVPPNLGQLQVSQQMLSLEIPDTLQKLIDSINRGIPYTIVIGFGYLILSSLWNILDISKTS